MPLLSQLITNMLPVLTYMINTTSSSMTLTVETLSGLTKVIPEKSSMSASPQRLVRTPSVPLVLSTSSSGTLLKRKLKRVFSVKRESLLLSLALPMTIRE
jgi:hypothetical protein